MQTESLKPLHGLVVCSTRSCGNTCTVCQKAFLGPHYMTPDYDLNICPKCTKNGDYTLWQLSQ